MFLIPQFQSGVSGYQNFCILFLIDSLPSINFDIPMVLISTDFKFNFNIDGMYLIFGKQPKNKKQTNQQIPSELVVDDGSHQVHQTVGPCRKSTQYNL